MKILLALAFISGLGLGCLGAKWLAGKQYHPSEPKRAEEQILESAPVATPDSNLLETSSSPLTKFAGNWSSADGQQSATIDGRFLQFHSAKGWPDLEDKTFLLGGELMILSESGLFWLKTLNSEPDRITFVKEDLSSKDLSSFTLYREGTSKANSRSPLSTQSPPPEIQALLDEISSIEPGSAPKEEMNRLVFARFETAVVLSGMTSMGQTDDIWRLGNGDEWMLKLSHAEGRGLVRFQVVRGSCKAVENGEPGISGYTYPYFVDGKLITGVSPPGLHQVSPAGKRSKER